MPGSECACAWRRLLPEVVIQAGGSPAVALDYSAPSPGVTWFRPGGPQARTGENRHPCEPKPALDGGSTLSGRRHPWTPRRDFAVQDFVVTGPLTIQAAPARTENAVLDVCHASQHHQ